MTRARDVNPVRIRREQQGLSLNELAAASKSHAAMLSMCEGGFVPQLKTQNRIAAALATTPEQLWPEEYR